MIDEIRITNKDMDGKQVKDIPFHKDSYLMLIKRGEEMHIPHGDTLLKFHDTVIVFGTESAQEDIRNKFRGI